MLNLLFTLIGLSPLLLLMAGFIFAKGKGQGVKENELSDAEKSNELHNKISERLNDNVDDGAASLLNRLRKKNSN